jgi:hypothetical protein
MASSGDYYNYPIRFLASDLTIGISFAASLLVMVILLGARQGGNAELLVRGLRC